MNQRTATPAEELAGHIWIDDVAKKLIAAEIERRTQELEAEGCTRSDAQSVVEAELRINGSRLKSETCDRIRRQIDVTSRANQPHRTFSRSTGKPGRAKAVILTH